MISTIKNVLNRLIHKFVRSKSKKLIYFLMASSSLAILQFIYILLRFKYVNTTVPLFYTKPWSSAQLVPKNYLFLIPVMSILLIPATISFFQKSRKYFLTHLGNITLVTTILTITALGISLFRIIQVSSKPFEPLIDPVYLTLILPFIAAYVLTYLITPKFINLFETKGIVTNPKLHKHPGMIKKTPSARGGGVVFVLVVIITSIIFIKVSLPISGIFFAMILLAALGILDDYQNTNIQSKLKLLENPLLRLGLTFAIVLLVTATGVRIEAINNPLGGLIYFSQVPLLTEIVTVVWIVWLINLLSWSNGVDGQYGGIVGVALIAIAILALRFVPIQDIHMQVAKLAVISAGTAFGITKYNWYPSKIMWGFGAAAAGLILATTSILIESKTAASTMIILVPFLDALVSMTRRIIQRRNPLKGDMGHLHHLLHKKGWGFRRIAVFYWITTGISGLVVIISAEKTLPLVVLTLSGIIAFGILALNYSAGLLKKSSDEKSIQTLISQ